ncbi:electron transport complex subunit RsxD [Pelagibaculum spongiae]|uniref:Ion-translocating oxidoreductase complex subunit D n=1 Tax=Pelagibaculum spongiae TaxID=2080658 RepID=A0A2V1GX36_9GAMM|nr:electron transport complex subunit RsxD [Pelagibaculum spongiae]PVZ64343.1 electron transport complex subunit RsxD [Pelagibaculum spongiae]
MFAFRSSPHTHGRRDTGWIMRQVMLAAVPAIAIMLWQFGFGVLFNLAIAMGTALLVEGIMLRQRQRPVRFFLKDGSALLTALLLAIAIPPTAPWWLTVVGVVFAIAIAKQLYGGLGNNPFNPAMAGYVLLLISFPVQMTSWLAPIGVGELQPNLLQAAQITFSSSFNGQPIDAFTMATPLDSLRTGLINGQTTSEIITQPIFGWVGGSGWELINLALLLGGIYMLSRRVIEWRIPLAVLLGLLVPATLFYAFSPDQFASPLMHLFSGGTMLGAFFIATDPVSASTTPKGRLIFGAGVGLLIWLIRSFGQYPDAVAFAVLLMNMAAPAIDHLTRTRAYGH